MLKQLLPDPSLAPAGEALKDTIPVAVAVREQAPLGATAGDPMNRFNETATLEFIPDVDAGTGFKERIDALPSLVR